MTLDNRVLWRLQQLTRLQLLVATCPLNSLLHALRQDINTCGSWKEGLFHFLPTDCAGQPAFSSNTMPAKSTMVAET